MRPVHTAILVLFATITAAGAFAGIIGAIFYRQDTIQSKVRSFCLLPSRSDPSSLQSYTTSTCEVLSHTIEDNQCTGKSVVCYQPYWEVRVVGINSTQWATTRETAVFAKDEADKLLTDYEIGSNYTCYYTWEFSGGEWADVVWNLPSFTRGYIAMGVGFPSCAIGVIGSLVILLYVRKQAYEVYF